MAAIAVSDQLLPAGRPRLYQSVRALKGVGPFFSTRLNAQGICTLRDLVQRITENTRQSNTQFFTEVLLNPRRGQCVGEPRLQSNELRRYLVDATNLRAWQSIDNYLRAVARANPAIAAGQFSNRIPTLPMERRAPRKRPPQCKV